MTDPASIAQHQDTEFSFLLSLQQQIRDLQRVVNAGFSNEIGYDQITASVTVTSGTQATGTTVITCASHIFDGEPVMCQFFAPVVAPAANDFIVPSLFEGSTCIGQLCDVQGGTAALDVPGAGWLRFTPTAGAHTYKLTAYRSSVNGIIFAGIGGTAAYVPAFIRFTKV